MLFKNKSMLVKMVKDQNSAAPEPAFEIDSEKINQIVKESIKNVAIGIVAVAGSLTVLKTASTVIINACPKN